ncbi:MAG TPA: TMEM43 family protein, partial [Geminicoccaceae bacterium]
AGVVLARNEWRLAGRLGALDAAAAQVTTLDPALPPPDADPARPVWLTGPARAEGSLRDPLFPAATADALRLDRLAETRQWREIRETGSGGDRNTRYEEVWSAERIDSALFQQRAEHANPAPLPLEPASFPAGDVRLGRHRLSPELLAPLPATSVIEPASLGPTNAAGRRFVPAGDWLTTGNPASPRVGDARVRWSYVPEGPISVLGAHDGTTLVPWRAPSGEAVALAARGEVAPADLLGAAGRNAWGEAWRLRLFVAGGLTLLFLIASPALANLVPAFEGARVRSRLVTALTLAAGWTALACGAGWIAARTALPG